MVSRFVAWLDTTNYESHDPYDIWGTGFGRFARRRYYEKHPLGTLLTAPLILMEALSPFMRSLVVGKKRFATADAQLVLAFLNMAEINSKKASTCKMGMRKVPSTGADDVFADLEDRSPNSESSSRRNWGLFSSNSWIDRAKHLADRLLSYSINGYSGHCWGYPFDWQSVNGIIRRNTPLITATPYCFEAFLGLYNATGEGRYLEIARSIFEFVSKDLNDTPVGADSTAASYTPHDRSKVVNASAYRAFVLCEGAYQFGLREPECNAMRNINFILQTQREDGSWLYAVDNPGEAFIDHFHTCFVLKNLFKINRRMADSKIDRAIKRGYAYYRENLFQHDGLPKTYSIEPRLQVVRLEMYNFAEAITLGVLLRWLEPDAFSISHRLAAALRSHFQLEKGFFVTRVYIGGIKHTMPYLRWPQAQLFYAVTNLLSVCEESASQAFPFVSATTT
jgi:hypothetical protein